MALSTAVRQAYARAGTGTLHLVAVELSHSLVPTLRHVNYDRDISVNAATYLGHGMSVVEPEVGDEPAAALQIVYDGVSGTLNPVLSLANETDEPIAAKVTPFAYNSRTGSVIGTVGTFDLEVRRTIINLTTVTLECGFISPANQPFPSIKYAPDTHPSLYN